MVTPLNWTESVPLSAANLDQMEKNAIDATTGHAHTGAANDGKLLGATSISGAMGNYAAKEFSTEYLAETDGFVVIIFSGLGGAGNRAFCSVFIGAAAPGTKYATGAGMLDCEGFIGTTIYGGCCCPVNKGQYWTAYYGTQGTITKEVRWIPLGS